MQAPAAVLTWREVHTHCPVDSCVIDGEWGESVAIIDPVDKLFSNIECE